jgi:hypothetical protein
LWRKGYVTVLAYHVNTHCAIIDKKPLVPHVAVGAVCRRRRGEDDDDDGGAIETRDIIGEVKLAKIAGAYHMLSYNIVAHHEPLEVRGFPHDVEGLGQSIGIPELPVLISRFLYEQEHPDLQIALIDVLISVR